MIISNALSNGYKILTDIFNCYEYDDTGQIKLQDGFKYNLIYENNKYNTSIDLTISETNTETDSSDKPITDNIIDERLIVPYINYIPSGYTVSGYCSEGDIIDIILPDNTVVRAQVYDNTWFIKSKTLLIKDDPIYAYAVSKHTGKKSLKVLRRVGHEGDSGLLGWNYNWNEEYGD